VSNLPYSRRRLRDDLVTALPAIGMIVGALAGAGLGLLNPEASAVNYAGIGIAVGLVLGLFLRVVFRRD
jgi:hypothetical protein